GYVAGGGTDVVLPCAENSCTIPDSLRIALSVPANGQHYTGASSIFAKTVLSGGAGSYDEVAIGVDGSWTTANPDGAVDAYSLTSAALPVRAAPYAIQSRVRQGNTTLYSAMNMITVDASAGVSVTLVSPVSGASVASGGSMSLSATTAGSVAVASVKFYANDQMIATGAVAGAAWSAQWQNIQTGSAGGDGTYSVTAVAFDGNGVQLAKSVGVTVTVKVVSGGAGGNSTPLPIVVEVPHVSDIDTGTLPGELSVTAAGAAAYSLPIMVPPGTADLQPTLSLDYNSSGQNSMVGLGWSLSGFSSIHRCGKTIAQDGENGRISFNAADRLCLDGQRLVLANRAENDANYWANDAQYRTEIDSFSRISSQVVGGKRSFKVEAKSGRIMTYGGATGYVTPVVPDKINTGEFAPQPVAANKAEAQSWAVDRIEDRSGNYISITYKQIAITGEHYAEGIRYGGSGLAAHAGVVIEHEDRPDAWTRYIDETRNDLRTRIKSIKTYVGDDLSGDIAATGALVRTYKLAYERSATSGRSLLASVEGCAYDVSAKKDVCLPKTEFNWGKPVEGRAAGFDSKGLWPNAPHLMTWNDNAIPSHGANHADYFAFSDFENHGYTDVLEKRVASPVPPGINTAAVIAREASNPINPGTMQASYRYFHNNGSGFDVYNYGLNTGKNFAVLEVGDFNGDGAPDLLVASEDGTQICLSPLGKVGALAGTSTPIVFTCDPNRPAVGGNTSLSMPYVVDILGDGRSAHYSQIGNDSTAKVCIPGKAECEVDSAPPGTVLGFTTKDDGSRSLAQHDYTAIDQMVDFAGVGKPYDARWNRPHFEQYYYDEDGTKTTNTPDMAWDNLQPELTLTGFERPGKQNAAFMYPYTYPKYPTPCFSVYCAPYNFEVPTQGGNISGDFSGSGYSG
uniref:Ig-like domain-containing protein n=1 Tax=Duganella sp. S19_KUP01_CR8 TaxID=3025502 RepID=UPI002FCDD7FB